MTTDPQLVESLKGLLESEEELFRGLHTQEHVFEREGYDKLEEWYDKQVDHTRERRRCVLKRILAADEIPNDPYGATWQVVPAYERYLTMLQNLLSEYTSAIEVAESAENQDEVSDVISILYHHVKCVACCIQKTEKKISQVKAIGESGFLSTQL